jgi:hypothetical protein
MRRALGGSQEEEHRGRLPPFDHGCPWDEGRGQLATSAVQFAGDGVGRQIDHQPPLAQGIPLVDSPR